METLQNISDIRMSEIFCNVSIEKSIISRFPFQLYIRLNDLINDIPKNS